MIMYLPIIFRRKETINFFFIMNNLIPVADNKSLKHSCILSSAVISCISILLEIATRVFNCKF